MELSAVRSLASYRNRKKSRKKEKHFKNKWCALLTHSRQHLSALRSSSYSILQTPQDKAALLRHIRTVDHTPCLPSYPPPLPPHLSQAFFPVQPQNVWKAGLKRNRSSLLSTNLFNAYCTWVVIALPLRKDHCSCLAKAVAYLLSLSFLCAAHLPVGCLQMLSPLH